MIQTAPSFLGILGRLAGTGQQENQCSRAFMASFLYSSSFRAIVVRLLHQVCKIKYARVDASHWNCNVEVRTPIPGGGRIDIEIIGSNKPAVIFHIESKLESPLTRLQLSKYRQHGAKRLVAITKYTPQVTANEIAELGCFVIRWQDVHDELIRRLTGIRGADRLVVLWMIEYLEELGMAYRDDVTFKDIRLCQRIFCAASSREKYAAVSARNGFETADAILRLLDDVRERLIELRPRLDKWSRWGSGYFQWTDVNAGRRNHVLAMRLIHPTHSAQQFVAGLWLPEDLKPTWYVQYLNGSKELRSEEIPIGRLLQCEKLSSDKIVRHLSSTVGRWRLC